MAEEDVRNILKTDIQKIVPEMNEAACTALVEFLIDEDFVTLSDLRHVKVDDIRSLTKLKHARKLVEVWEKRSESVTKPHQEQDVPAPVCITLTNSEYRINWDKIEESILREIRANKLLSKDQLDKVVATIVKDVLAKFPDIGRDFFNGVAKDMVAARPNSFKDIVVKASENSKENVNLTTDCEKLTYKLKNKRDSLLRKKKGRAELEAPNTQKAYGCIRWRVLDPPSDLTEEQLEEVIKSLQDYYYQTDSGAWDKVMIAQKMKQTFFNQRRDINSQTPEPTKRKASGETTLPPAPMTTQQIADKYPFLFMPIGMSVHFEELTGVDFDLSLQTWLQTHSKSMIDFLSSKSPENKLIEKKMLKAEQRGTCHAEDSKLMAIIKMVSNCLGDKNQKLILNVQTRTKWFDVHKEIELPGTPSVVACAHSLFKSKKFYISIDGQVKAAVKTFRDALKVAFCSYFCLNIAYAASEARTLDFIQRNIGSINPPGGSKVPRQRRGRNTVAYSLHLLNAEYAKFNQDQTEIEDSSIDEPEQE